MLSSIGKVACVPVPCLIKSNVASVFRVSDIIMASFTSTPGLIDRKLCPTSVEVIVEAELATTFLCPGCVFDYMRKYFSMLRSAIISHFNGLMVSRKVLFNMGRNTPQLSKIFL